MSTKEQESGGEAERVTQSIVDGVRASLAGERAIATMRAALAEYDASPGAKYDHADCACTWCAFVRTIREAVADA